MRVAPGPLGGGCLLRALICSAISALPPHQVHPFAGVPQQVTSLTTFLPHQGPESGPLLWPSGVFAVSIFNAF